MTEPELQRRLAAIEGQLVKVQKIETALRDRPAAALGDGRPAAPPAMPGETGQAFDVLTGLALVMALLSELQDHADRLRHLEINHRSRTANARHREKVANGEQVRRPVGRPRKVIANGHDPVPAPAA
jgi:hypothetical protein